MEEFKDKKNHAVSVRMTPMERMLIREIKKQLEGLRNGK